MFVCLSLKNKSFITITSNSLSDSSYSSLLNIYLFELGRYCYVEACKLKVIFISNIKLLLRRARLVVLIIPKRFYLFNHCRF